MHIYEVNIQLVPLCMVVCFDVTTWYLYSFSLIFLRFLVNSKDVCQSWYICTEKDANQIAILLFSLHGSTWKDFILEWY